MFLKAGCIFCATLLVFKKLLLQKWAHFSVYCYTDLRNFDKTSKLTIKLALPQQIFLPQSSQMQYSYDSLSDVGEIRVYQRADFQSGSRVLKKVF